MKKIINIKTKNKKYKTIIENGCINRFLESEIKDNHKKFIFIDKKISTLLNKKILNRKNVLLIKINSSEKIKSIKYYNKTITFLLKNKIDRNSAILVIGGGTLGDLCGFIASTVLRGVRLIQIPSTLLAQVDSSIGGKNGVNTKTGKNLIGTFYQPNIVIIDPTILSTLPKREIRSGYAEIVKYALINDKIFFNWLKNNLNKLLSLEKKTLFYAIYKSVKIKAKYVSLDEKEILNSSKSRAMLNFGHTFGHALEALNKFHTNLKHGEAISIGMSLAAKISYNLGNLTKYELQEITNHFKKAGLPSSTDKIKNNNFYKLIAKDKKNTDNKTNLILLNKIGKAYYEKKLNIPKIKKLIN